LEVADPSSPAGPDPLRDAVRSGLNQATPACHWLPRKVIAPGLTAPPNGSSATATPAPPMLLALRP
jgi:hypothetical protein